MSLSLSGPPRMSTWTESPLPAATTPTAVGRYRIVRTLGEGLMGGVHLAVRDRQYWVLRLLHDTRVRRLPLATQLHGNALDPHLVSYRETGLDPEVGAFIASDPVDGTALDTKLREPHQVVELLLPLLEAVQRLHAHGGVHGTIKPSNVLVRRSSGTAILVDAGLAYAATPAQRPLLLTHAYPHLAPEVVEAYETGSAERIIATLGVAADIYSAGLLVAETLVGRRLFPAGRDARELMTRKRTSSVVVYGIDEGRTAPLAQAIRAATASDPARRPRVLADLIHGLSLLAR